MGKKRSKRIPKWNYEKAGVQRGLADLLVDRIKARVKKTHSSAVRGAVGGYASLYQLEGGKVLAASTDGVGTKLKLAFETGIHHTVGIDLVAMSVNDLICVGATPLFFLDYFATGRLKLSIAEAVIAGVTAGCREAGCALVGGETAEMPGFYAKDEYDLAGFAVGLARTQEVLPRSRIPKGSVLLGLASSGFHSNGYSLLRRWLPSQKKKRMRLMKELLRPTRIYVKSLLPLIAKRQLLGLAHITGSGFLNVPRMSEDLSYRIELPPLSERASVFEWAEKRGKLSLQESVQTFNSGIGMVLAVKPENERTVKRRLEEAGERVWVIGETLPRKKGEGSLVEVFDRDQRALLKYS